MTYPSIKIGFALVLVGIAISSAVAQNSEKCRGPIYSGKEVATPAKITTPADLNPIYQAFGRGIHGRVTVDAVLCRSGQVTDIKVVQSSLHQRLH